MEKIKKDNAEITNYGVSEDVSFSPVLLFDPIEVEKREIADLPIEIEDIFVETVDLDTETNSQSIQPIEDKVESSEALVNKSSAMMESAEMERNPTENSMSSDQLDSLIQEIHTQLIELASPILSQLQSDSLLPSSLTVSSLSPERIAYFTRFFHSILANWSISFRNKSIQRPHRSRSPKPPPF